MIDFKEVFVLFSCSYDGDGELVYILEAVSIDQGALISIVPKDAMLFLGKNNVIDDGYYRDGCSRYCIEKQPLLGV